MGNFDFLLKDKDYSAFAEPCIEAEKAMNFSTIMTAICCRRALELSVKWVYQFDSEMKVPYRDNLSSLVNHRQFKNILDSDLLPALRYIIKLGNVSVHNNSMVKREEAILALKNLFQFVQWIDYCYGDNYQERTFDATIFDSSKKVKERESVREVEELKEKIDVIGPSVKEMQQELPKDKRLKFMNKRKEVANSEITTFRVDKISESETRRRFIDIELRLAGWNFDKDIKIEEKINGMPNKAGFGKIDYVLYGKNGLPLAIVEAKKTLRSPKEGRQQAKLYAKFLGEERGQQPIVFYTNGFETWMIEEPYPSRKVAGFYTQDELQLIIDRRKTKKPLSAPTINDDISDRKYQKEAIISVCEAFEDNQREALLVMATGSGKTRTVISIVDVLTQANWAKNILFLADRTSLVKQAFRNFNKLLPNLTLCNLLESDTEKNNFLSSRMIFSTYPTMMNAIDSIKNEENRLLTVGHFDLIIVDEAHRSIYQKYQAIFDYFDALVVGLTATPREDIDKNTYDLFNLENGVPTYAYDLDRAIEDGYLVSYKTIETALKIPSEGIHYESLSEEEKEAFDDTFEDEPEVKDIDPEAINNWLFNQDTIDLVLKEVMNKSIKDSSGDEIGKTIIFAKNHLHAEMIKDRFDILFPKKGDSYAEVIDYTVDYYQSLIDAFSVKDEQPQIAISVDMLDTGIDVPELVNLVFFKKVRSKIKFWQMLGRGTRLCEDLFGPGQDKTVFLIFDYGGNFEFFREDKHIGEVKLVTPLSQRILNLQIELIYEMQDLQYQETPFSEYRNELIDKLLQSVVELDQDNFRIRMEIKYVDKFQKREVWNSLTIIDVNELKNHVTPLIEPKKDDELALRFDAWMFTIELSNLTKNNSTQAIRQVMESAQELQKLGTIPQILEQKEIIQKIQESEFWEEPTLQELEEIRLSLRELIRFIPKNTQKIYYTNFEDEIISVSEDDAPLIEVNDLKSYKEKIESYIKTHLDNTAVYKLHHNRSLTKQDVETLEMILWNELGSREQYEKNYGNKSVTRLVRELIGIDKGAANVAFSSFLSSEKLNTQQINFVQVIIEYVVKNGYLEKTQLLADPFKRVGNIVNLFKEDQMKNILNSIDQINNNAESVN
ncbi:MAG: DEAD/DEAH box helicase family protein [Enterococcus sp.]